MRTSAIIVALTYAFCVAVGAAAEYEDFTFVVMGDTRPIGPMNFDLSVAAKRIVEEINWINPALVVHTGDLVWARGEPEEVAAKEFATAFELFGTIEAKVYYVPGNHDYSVQPFAAGEFLRLTGQREYFSADYEGVHFIILNTELPGEVASVTGEQLEWLKEDLDENKAARAIYVFMHRPMFGRQKDVVDVDATTPPDDYGRTRGQSISDIENYRELTELFARHKVDAVIAGHQHLFYRTEHKGVPYYVVGGGGAEFDTPPDEGGFFNYLVVNVTDEGTETYVMEPFQFDVRYEYAEENGKARAKARINNVGFHEVVLPLRGIKFTLPEGDYSLQADTVPSYSFMKRENPEFAASWGIEKVDAAVLLEETNSDDATKKDYYVRVESPGGYSLAISLTPE
ncbi:MAG: metallophosphoesterase [Candidatus Coatesbacteria bacterium]|nr:MAG: metallophosphoesterase [Candidatus Coatesbacteria bacterium]